MQMSVYKVVWVLVALVQLGVTTWCVVAPLFGQLDDLSTFAGWKRIYSFSLSNLDVWVLAAFETGANLALLHAAPKGKIDDESSAWTYKKDRLCIRIIARLAECSLLIKACAVAVNAPDAVLPPAEPAEPTFVGLLYMFVSIGACMLGSFLQSWLACQAVRQQEDLVSEEAEEGSVEAPLLPAQGKQEAGKDKSKKAKVNPKTVSALLTMSMQDWPIVAAAFFCGTIAALAAALIPYYTGLVIDYASIEPDRQQFIATTVKLLLISLLCGAFTGMRGGLFTLSMTKLNVRLRKQLFHQLLQMEIGFFDMHKTGEITSRLATDTTSVSNQVSLNLNVMMRSLTQAATVLAFMFAASWRLTVVTFILVPVVLLISKVYGKYFSKLAKKVQTELAEANSVAEEVLSTMTTVKAHAAQDSSEAAYHAKLAAYYSLLLQEAIVYALYACINTFLPNAVAAVVLFYGGNLVLAGLMSPGSLVSFMLYQQSLSSAFQTMGDVFSSLTAAVGAADKVIELMNRQPEISTGGSLVPASFSGQIELRDVVFHYPARPSIKVLQGLSLVVNPGEVVALVGTSGGGKSSIVKLVERFYLPQSGTVLIDGRDVGQYSDKWLRRRVALVSQEPVLYARSIRRNITFGLEREDGVPEPPNDAEVEEAARQANAHNFILSFPEGYETNCGEKGVQMSGGQKQRIAIARALVRRPDVLLLDEATSALDADSEAVVQEALDRMMHGRSTLVIAHRLSTIQNAHRIFVITKGVVQEVGTHDELLRADGVYATLVRRQLQKSVSTASMGSLTGKGSAAEQQFI